jgi:hypothetical protein
MVRRRSATNASWCRTFGINIPLVVVICVGALAFLACSPRSKGRVDATGAVLSIVGLGLLALGVIEGRTYISVGSYLAAGVLLAGLLATVLIPAATPRQRAPEADPLSASGRHRGD